MLKSCKAAFKDDVIGVKAIGQKSTRKEVEGVCRFYGLGKIIIRQGSQGSDVGCTDNL